MSAADVFRGLLALGSGAGKAYAVKKKREIDANVHQEIEQAKRDIQMENLYRLTQRDQTQADIGHQRADAATLLAEVAKLRGDFATGPMGAAQIANLGSQMGYRTGMLEQGQQRIGNQMSEFGQTLEELKKWHAAQTDPTTGMKVSGGGATGATGNKLEDYAVKRIINQYSAPGNEAYNNDVAQKVVEGMSIDGMAFYNKVRARFNQLYPKKAGTPDLYLTQDKDFRKIVEEAHQHVTSRTPAAAPPPNTSGFTE